MAPTAIFTRALESSFLLLCLFPILVFSLACPAPAPTQTGTHPELQVFKYIPLTPSSASLGCPVQFNGSVPGAQDTDQHVGWFFGNNPPTHNKPVDLVSFVQGNKKAGIVFWAYNTALQTYLEPVPGAEGTYAVRNGWTETPEKVLADKFTIVQWGSGKGGVKWIFGWNGNYKNWFTCGSKGSGFLGLYYGKRLKGCSRHFLIEAKYL